MPLNIAKILEYNQKHGKNEFKYLLCVATHYMASYNFLQNFLQFSITFNHSLNTMNIMEKFKMHPKNLEKLKFHAFHVYTQNGPSIHNFQNFNNFL